MMDVHPGPLTMYVQLGPWTPKDLPLKDNCLYTEEDIKAMADYIKDEEDKRILNEILASLRTPHPK